MGRVARKSVFGVCNHFEGLNQTAKFQRLADAQAVLYLCCSQATISVFSTRQGPSGL